MADARIQVPASVRPGEAFEVKIIIRHPMETGFRLTDDGVKVPRNLVRELLCRFNGGIVFRAEPGSGISANPMFGFWLAVREPGELVFEWVDDAGERGSARARVAVTD